MAVRSLALAACAALAVAKPEQIHLSWTGLAGEMAVDFVAASAATVAFGTSPNPTGGAAASCQQQTLNGYTAFFCTFVMKNLAPQTTYYYAIKDTETTTSYSFASSVARQPVFALYADFGYTNDESLNALISDAAAGGFDAVIHAGDFAYDLDSDASKTGNFFMNSIQPYAATMPYMGSVGNHEAYGTQGGGAFAQFAARFRALTENVAKNSGGSTFWYSFNTPLAHIFSFTSETWTMSAQQIKDQAAWLEADLSAVNRTATPWVIAFSHKSFSMDETTWEMYDFMTTHKVDLQIVGHWHETGRYPPLTSTTKPPTIDYACISADNSTYTNPKYPTIVVVGAPGDRELNPSHCAEEWQLAGKCSGNYGYAKLQVNETVLHYTWNTTIPVKGSPNPTFSDELFIVRA